MKRITRVLSCVAFVALASCGKDNSKEQSYRIQDHDIVKKGSYVYFITPLKNLIFSEQTESLGLAKNQVIKKLQETYPKGRDTTFEEAMSEASDEKLGKFLGSAQKWLNENNAALSETGLDMSTMVPTGFILSLGGRISLSVGAGAGTFLNVGVVVVPVKVTRFNKLAPTEINERYLLRWSAIAFPGLNIGAGVGGGSSFRAGAGLVWGDLTDPRNFRGIVGGLTGNLAATIGHTFSVGVLNQETTNRSNLFALGQWQAGGAVEASIQALGGKVFALNDYLKNIGIQNPAGVTSEPSSGEMQWRKAKDDPSKKLSAQERAALGL